MNLDDLIITVFCVVDDALNDILGTSRLRQRSPTPILSDSEVITMEIVGEYLELGKDKSIYDHFFPAMAKIHRTTFTRQAANLCQVKKRIWQRLQVQLPKDEGLHIADSVPVPVCKFARANRHKLFRGWADYGHDATEKHTFYGFRLHILATLPGIVVGFALAPANIHETQV